MKLSTTRAVAGLTNRRSYAGTSLWLTGSAMRRTFTTAGIRSDEVQSPAAASSDVGRAVASVQKREAGPLRVLISGATVGGLTLAHCLKSRGVQADVVDVDTNHDRFLGRSAVVSGDALRILQGLGLRSQLENEGTVLNKAVTGLYSGKLIHQHNFGPAGEAQGTAGAVAIPAYALAELLAESWERRGGRINRSTAILTMREIEGKGMRCSFKDSRLGSRDYDLIVLADTVNSGNTPGALKEEVYLNPHLTTTQVCSYGVWSTYLQRPFTVAPDLAVDVWGLGNRAGYVPMPEDLLYFWGTHRADMAPFLKGGAREGRDLPSFANFGTGFNMRSVLQQVEQSESTCWVHYPRDMRIKQWSHRNGRVVLLGSAAYSLAPLPLHETTLPMEDAAVLAYALASHALPSDALSAYAKRRMPRVQAAQDWAWYQHSQATKTGRWQLALRNIWMGGPGRYTFSRRQTALSRPI